MHSMPFIADLMACSLVLSTNDKIVGIREKRGEKRENKMGIVV